MGQGSAGPLKVAAEELRHVLGVRDVSYKQGTNPLAVVDTPLA